MAVGICGTDVHIIEGKFGLAQPPLVLGHEIGGVVEAIGSGVERVKVGDRVTIDQVIGCGACFFCRRGSRQFCTTGFELGITADGGCQEALVVPQENVFVVPATISNEAAAILDMEVWAAISKCGVDAGDTVVVFGPGPAGMVACQVARILGAARVILAGPDGERMRYAQKLGLADTFLLIDRENATKRILEETGGLGANVAVECAGAADALSDALDAVIPGGRIVTFGVHTRPFESFDVNRIVLRDLVVFGALSDRQGWETMIELVSTGKLSLEPLITHRFPFEEAPAAYDLVRQGCEGLIKAVITF
jgi:threonine dehydrogenase-like Zn-dependent dehydrogenase